MKAEAIAIIATQPANSKLERRKPKAMPMYMDARRRGENGARKAPSLLLLPVARARAPSKRSKTKPKATTNAAGSHSCIPASTAPTTQMAKPGSVRMFGVKCRRMKTAATGASMLARTFARSDGETTLI